MDANAAVGGKASVIRAQLPRGGRAAYSAGVERAAAAGVAPAVRAGAAVTATDGRGGKKRRPAAVAFAERPRYIGGR
jgi:hypothetical protein